MPNAYKQFWSQLKHCSESFLGDKVNHACSVFQIGLSLNITQNHKSRLFSQIQSLLAKFK